MIRRILINLYIQASMRLWFVMIAYTLLIAFLTWTILDWSRLYFLDFRFIVDNMIWFWSLSYFLLWTVLISIPLCGIAFLGSNLRCYYNTSMGRCISGNKWRFTDRVLSWRSLWVIRNVCSDFRSLSTTLYRSLFTLISQVSLHLWMYILYSFSIILYYLILHLHRMITFIRWDMSLNLVGNSFLCTTLLCLFPTYSLFRVFTLFFLLSFILILYNRFIIGSSLMRMIVIIFLSIKMLWNCIEVLSVCF